MTPSRFLESLWIRFRRRVIPVNLEIRYNTADPKVYVFEGLVPGENIALVDSKDGKEYITIRVV